MRIGWAAAWLLCLDGFATQLWQAGALDAVWDPQSLAKLAGGPVAAGALQLLWLLCVAGTVLLGLGWRTRVVGPALFGLSAMLGAVCYSYGKLDPTTNVLLLALLPLAFAPWGHRWSLDARSRRAAWPAPTRFRHWPLHLATAAIVLPYASAGLLKLLHWGSPTLAMDRSLQWWAYLDEAGILHRPGWGAAAAEWASGEPLALLALGVLAPLTELAVLGALLSDRLRIAVLGLLCAFQAALSAMSGIMLPATWLACLLALGATVALLPGAGWRGWRHRWFPKSLAPVPPARAEAPWLRWASLAAGLVAAVALARLPFGGFLPDVDPLPGLAIGDGQAAMPLLTTLTLLVGSAVALGVGAVVVRDALRRVAGPEGPPGGVLLYDQDCGFCQRWARWVQARGASPHTAFAPCQESREVRRQAGLRYSQCMEEAYLVVGPWARGGAAAINGALARLPGARNWHFRAVALLYGLNGVRHAEDLGYRWVARNRHRLAPGECVIPPGES